MEIREAKSEDIHQMVALWLELMQYHQDHHPVFTLAILSEEEILVYLKRRILTSDTQVFVCAQEDTLIGFIIGSFSEGSDIFKLYRKGYIAETIINEAYRGKGVGQALYAKAEEWLKSKGADHIELQVAVQNGAENFWSNNGFVVSTHHMIKEV